MSLAGIEHRFTQKKQSKTNVTSVWTPINSIFFLGSVVILFGSSFVITSSVLSSAISYTSNSNASSTSIPWINNKSDCKHSGRTWYDNKCWDDEHSPMF